ncbi:50S ribosomal protein L3 N(5)-glutamine methyltransferase [Reyranella sp. CPCC 100927]|uniref:50S ribosomal protein L3 N(5)-glutamine methyltransferase n=1 Tax=Reyranella sp. CPCC 100927 TaxID=2599616 RepID=UPI0011B69AA3|nr:50S ribosomal protein L3 N(5)-glutamine methyltransferase [Reyranella sp. CPCC 100927]TWS96141.1 50S ribosomal protein L3 N(5)-glutamine methyltransferase [Reyranella sp. CPCC 100927]
MPGRAPTRTRASTAAGKPDPRREIHEFITLRDALRYAVSTFRAAGLHFGHGTSTALDEAAFLILESLHLPIDDFNAFADARLTARERTLLGERIALRVDQRLPAAYLTGRAYLGGVPFRCDKRALVPRSYIAELLRSALFDGSDDGTGLVADPQALGSVLDLCTGGGSLAILAAYAFPNATVDAVDLSAEALALAAENVSDHGLEDRVRLIEGDLFAPLAGRRYDLILTNPPYVGRAVMERLPPEYRHEPAMALASGEDGFDLVHRILAAAADHLEPDGGLLCEIGEDRDILEAAYPRTPFLWLDTARSDGEVFWLTSRELQTISARSTDKPRSRKRAT